MEILHLTGPAPLYTNTFLVLDGAGTAVAVDPAADAQAYLAQLEKHGAKLAAILLTHGHFDHVGAVRALKQATGAPVHLARADAGASRMLPLATACHYPGRSYFRRRQHPAGRPVHSGAPYAGPHGWQLLLPCRGCAFFRRHAV